MILALIFVFFSPFQAEARTADCSLKDKTFSVEDLTLPDKKDHSKVKQEIFIQSPKRKHSIVKDGKGNFGFIQGGDNSICTGTAAYILNETTVAILIGHSDIPFPDRLMMIVYDTKADRILKTEKDLGTFSKIDVHPEGFIFSRMIPRSNASTKKMKSPLTEREMLAVDKDLGAYQLVRMQKQKLTREFDPAISWDKTDWRKFFKDDKDFLEATGWDKKKRTFKNIVVYEASHYSRKESDTEEICIQLVEKRDSKLDAKKWRCIRERN